MLRKIPIAIAILFAGCNHPAKVSTAGILSRAIIVSDGCDGCEAMYEGMPPVEKLSDVVMIASPTEPGEPLELSGVIYQSDGTTPAENIILYVYHTDATGNYTPSDTQTLGKRNGHLRGWMKTGKNGQYKFITIRPASYPNSDIQQHVHPVIKEPGKIEYYIDEFVFDDDPNLSNEERKRLENRGGSGLINLTKNKNGTWTGKRNIILGRNIPNYR